METAFHWLLLNRRLIANWVYFLFFFLSHTAAQQCSLPRRGMNKHLPSEQQKIISGLLLLSNRWHCWFINGFRTSTAAKQPPTSVFVVLNHTSCSQNRADVRSTDVPLSRSTLFLRRQIWLMSHFNYRALANDKKNLTFPFFLPLDGTEKELFVFSSFLLVPI